MKYWEIIAENLSLAGWSWGYTSQVDSIGRIIFSVDAHRSDGKRLIVRSDEILSAFLEIENQTKREWFPSRCGQMFLDT
jgi:hypothetical protein